MRAKDQRNGCHQIQRPDAGMIEIHEPEPDTGSNGNQVQYVAARQRQRLAIHDAGKFGKGDDGSGGGHRANEDAQKHFHLMDDLFGRGQAAGRCQFRIDADKDSCQTDKGMQRCHQLRHACHFNTPGHDQTNHRTDSDHDDQNARDGDLRAKNGSTHSKGHADNAEPDGALGAFLI